MRSRALPADFNMSHALHSPFGTTPTQAMGTPLPSPGIFPPYNENSGVRPLTVDTLRHVPNYEPYSHHFASPTGISPALGSFAFTPPQSSTETMSPGSAASNISSFSLQTQDSPRRNPFLPMSVPQGFGTPTNQMPRPPYHDRLNRTVGEAAGSPLRASISYSALGSAGFRHHQHQQERSNSFSEQPSEAIDRHHQQRSLTGPSSNTQGPYGLGFSCSYSSIYTHCEKLSDNLQTLTPKLSLQAPNSRKLLTSQYHRPHWICIPIVEPVVSSLVRPSRRSHRINHHNAQPRPRLSTQHLQPLEIIRSRVRISRTRQTRYNSLSKYHRIIRCRTTRSNLYLLTVQPGRKTSDITILEA